MKRGISFFFCRHKLALGICGLFPSVRLIAICNSRAMGEADENSDIDLFIVARSGEIWIVRFLVTLITTLFGVRRKNTHGLTKGSPKYIKKTKNKFCLSFFITEDAMSLDSIRLQPHDPYLDRWIETLIPIINKNNTLERFLEANGRGKSTEKKEGKKSGFLLSFFEGCIKGVWYKKTYRTYEKIGKPWGVIISDTMLKFHDNDQRKIYRDSQIKE